MTGAYIDKNYVYAVARVRCKENQLFTNQTFSELMGVKDAVNMLKLLKEKGWGKDSDIDIESILRTESEKLWEFIDEIVPDQTVLNVFKISKDFHNLKAAIKESTMEYPYEGIYLEEGITSYKLIRDAIKNKNYEILPDYLIDTAIEAHDAFLTTGDGQLCDIICDKKSIEMLVESGKKTSTQFLKTYAELSAVSFNIKIAMRASLTGKDKDFMERAIAECDTLDKDMLIQSALNGKEAICNYLSATDYKDAVDEIKKSLTLFERWCDNLLISGMKSCLIESFGLGPICAYILARENEIKTVRIIYTSQLNEFPEEMIKERVREAYV